MACLQVFSPFLQCVTEGMTHFGFAAGQARLFYDVNSVILLSWVLGRAIIAGPGRFHLPEAHLDLTKTTFLMSCLDPPDERIKMIVLWYKSD